MDTVKSKTPVIVLEDDRTTNTIGLHPDWQEKPHETAAVVDAAAADLVTPYGNLRNPRSASGRYYSFTEGLYGFYNAFILMFGMEPIGVGRPPLTKDIDIQEFIYRDPQGTVWNERDLNDRRVTKTQDLVDYILVNLPDYELPKYAIDKHHHELLSAVKGTMEIVGAKTRKIRVPVGEVKYPGHDDISIILAEEDGAPYGCDYPIFQLAVKAKKKDEKLVDGLVDWVDEFLRTLNMYQGRCFTWTGGVINYFDPFAATDPKNLAFSKRITYALENEVYAPMQYKEKARSLNPRLLSRRILLSGEPGTGKTEMTNCIAQVALQNGITACFLRPGSSETDLKNCLSFLTANTPAVLFEEDVETKMPDTEGLTTQQQLEARSLLLSMFDGAQTKGVEISIVLTTNYEEIIDYAMLRSGRLDLLIRTEAPDRESFQYLCELRIADLLPEDIDYDALWGLIGDMKASFLSSGLTTKAELYSLKYDNGERLSERDMESLLFTLREQSDLYTSGLQRSRESKKDTYTEAQQSVLRPLLDDLKTEIINSVH